MQWNNIVVMVLTFVEVDSNQASTNDVTSWARWHTSKKIKNILIKKKKYKSTINDNNYN